LAKARSLADQSANLENNDSFFESPSSGIDSFHMDSETISVSPPSTTETSTNTGFDSSIVRSGNSGRSSNGRHPHLEPNIIGFSSITNGPPMTIGRGIVTMRDSFRCKICGSSTCVSKEHVIHASLLKIIKPLDEPTDSNAISTLGASNENSPTIGQVSAANYPLVDNPSTLTSLDNPNALSNLRNSTLFNGAIRGFRPCGIQNVE
jgi:hypothetical protein